MVMEVTKPSPLVVGREFVRQYYTLLHSSPDHLHRFYNQHSSFTHSGVDPDASSKDDAGLVIGQKNIHDKIQQMNFRDCHAKISHVDAQATLGDGVVVQVFGELSNDGHQMRRFTQTFVLACQSPKKYYVHNDIFRYHDIYCEDEDQREEHDVGIDSTGATSNNSTDGSASSMMVQTNVFYQAPASNVIPVNVNASPAFAAAAAVVPAAPSQVNGIMHEEMLKNMATQTSQSPQIIAAGGGVAQAPQVLPIAPAPTALPIPVEPVAVVATSSEVNNQYDADQSNEEDSDTADNSKEMDVTSSEENAMTKTTPSLAFTSGAAPKNWANLVKAGPILGFTGAPPSMETGTTNTSQSFVAITQQQQQQAQQQKQAENYSVVTDRRPVTARVGGGGGNSDRERRISNNNNSSNNNNNNNNNNDGSSQLFLGNLPTSATDEELRNLFSVFGKIADLRIHTKQTQKGSNGRPVPNYGFITFVDPASCQRLQEAQPIFYPILNDKRGTKLNIEHKIRKNIDNNAGGAGTGAGSGRIGTGNGNDAERGRNGSSGRSDRRGGDDRNRQFSRSDRMGGGGGGGQRTSNNGSATIGTARR